MKRGRPAVDPVDASTKISLTLPARQYDELYHQARLARVTVPELIRQHLAPKLKSTNSPPSQTRE